MKHLTSKKVSSAALNESKNPSLSFGSCRSSFWGDVDTVRKLCGQEICAQKFRNAYQQKEIEKWMTHVSARFLCVVYAEICINATPAAGNLHIKFESGSALDWRSTVVSGELKCQIARPFTRDRENSDSSRTLVPLPQYFFKPAHQVSLPEFRHSTVQHAIGNFSHACPTDLFVCLFFVSLFFCHKEVDIQKPLFSNSGNNLSYRAVQLDFVSAVIVQNDECKAVFRVH